eukprot:scaffold1771_cov384-Prasinococcus_capsulatus_cf.AAC.8
MSCGPWGSEAARRRISPSLSLSLAACTAQRPWAGPGKPGQCETCVMVRPSPACGAPLGRPGRARAGRPKVSGKGEPRERAPPAHRPTQQMTERADNTPHPLPPRAVQLQCRVA